MRPGLQWMRLLQGLYSKATWLRQHHFINHVWAVPIGAVCPATPATTAAARHGIQNMDPTRDITSMNHTRTRWSRLRTGRLYARILGGVVFYSFGDVGHVVAFLCSQTGNSHNAHRRRCCRWYGWFAVGVCFTPCFTPLPESMVCV